MATQTPQRLANAAGTLPTMWGTVPTPYVAPNWPSRGSRSLLLQSVEDEWRRSNNKAGVCVSVVIGHEDFTIDPPTHISIKPGESDLNNCYITDFEPYSQSYLTLMIYIAIKTHILALETGPVATHLILVQIDTVILCFYNRNQYKTHIEMAQQPMYVASTLTN